MPGVIQFHFCWSLYVRGIVNVALDNVVTANKAGKSLVVVVAVINGKLASRVDVMPQLFTKHPSRRWASWLERSLTELLTVVYCLKKIQNLISLGNCNLYLGIII